MIGITHWTGPLPIGSDPLRSRWKPADLYHYHWTYDFPYNIGCFKGTSVQ